MADRDRFIRPFDAFVWRASMGYTVAIRRRVPGEPDKELSLDVLDLSWTKAEELRKLLETFFHGLPRERVGFGSVLRGAIKSLRGSVAHLERELAEQRKSLRREEERLRFVTGPRAMKKARRGG